MTDAAPDFILTCDLFERQAHLLASSLSQPIEVINTQRHIPVEHAQSWAWPDITAENIALLQYTSGSTGHPKGVMVTHGNLLHNLESISRNFEAKPKSQGVIWLPPYHDMGLIGGILVPMYNGFPVTLMSPLDFLQKPVRWLRAISDYKADISGGPNFAYDLCVNKVTPEEARRLDLSSWTLAFNGSEAIRAETLKRFAKKFGANGFRMEAFYPCYGLAESTLLVSGGKKAETPKTITIGNDSLSRNKARAINKINRKGRFETILTGCGQPLTGDLIVVDPVTHIPKDKNEIGEIWIKGASITKGYWNNHRTTENQYNAYVAISGEGPYFRTGDLGFLNENEIFLTGRLKELIVINGQNHYPGDIEFTVQHAHPALRKGCGAAFSIDTGVEEQLIVVQEVINECLKSFDVREAATAVFRAVLVKNGLRVSEAVFIEPSTIPKTTSGKICRLQCLKQYRTGALKTIGAIVHPKTMEGRNANAKANSRNLPEKLKHIPAQEKRKLLLTYLRSLLADTLGLSSFKVISVETPFFDLGLDSLAVVKLKDQIEQDLECSVETTLFFDYPTCEAVIDYLTDQVLDLNDTH